MHDDDIHEPATEVTTEAATDARRPGLRNRLRRLVHPHRRTVVRMVLALLAVIVVLAVVGGSIRAFSRHEEPGVDPSALTGLTPTWSADLGQGRVVGVAFEADRLYASSAQGLTVFDIPCDGDGEPCRPSWLSVVPDGPISAPVVSGDSVYAGSSSGQVYAFPATCDANGCPPRWVGVAGKGRVSRPGVNDDFVYVTSDRLYAFPAACGSADRTCLPAWTAPLPDAPTGDAPAVGGGVVVVASDSVEGGVSAFPAVCTEGCEPLWTGDTDGPATGVTIEGDTAYVVAHGSLLAFPLSCQGACHPTWTGTFVPGGAFAEGSPAPPGVGSGQVAIAGDDGTLWLFPATCPNPACGPLRSFDLGAEGLGRPVIEEGFVFVASEDGRLFAIGTGCDPSNVTTCDEAATTSLGSPTRAVPASGAGVVYAGDDAGTVHAFDLRASG